MVLPIKLKAKIFNISVIVVWPIYFISYSIKQLEIMKVIQQNIINTSGNMILLYCMIWITYYPISTIVQDNMFYFSQYKPSILYYISLFLSFLILNKSTFWTKIFFLTTPKNISAQQPRLDLNLESPPLSCLPYLIYNHFLYLSFIII